jgi:epoxyqueuosine reductase
LRLSDTCIRYTWLMESKESLPHATTDFAALARDIKAWGRELGFDEIGISDTDLTNEESYLLQWLDKGFHGSMDYMARHGVTRARPAALVPETLRVISVRLNYTTPDAKDSWSVIEDAGAAYISRYALGRDYHKVLRQKLQKLATRIEEAIGTFSYRVFTDSAPVMEVALAKKAGLGWRGKHTLLLTRDAGSMFFLGEIYTDLPLPIDTATTEHCGTCTKCIDICPTAAIVAPYQLDARRCISYLTIEHKGEIPVEFRRAMGNRIYGCDDCQLVCPWNKYAQHSAEIDFSVRHKLDDITLLDLLTWTETDFNKRMSGSAIRRIGYEQWLRNIVVALGNALADDGVDSIAKANIRMRLEEQRADASPLVQSHIDWALTQK